MAVNHIGTLIENKHNELDDKGRRKHSLEKLLWEPEDVKNKSVTADLGNPRMKGLLGSYVRK